MIYSNFFAITFYSLNQTFSEQQYMIFLGRLSLNWQNSLIFFTVSIVCIISKVAFLNFIDESMLPVETKLHVRPIFWRSWGKAWHWRSGCVCPEGLGILVNRWHPGIRISWIGSGEVWTWRHPANKILKCYVLGELFYRNNINYIHSPHQSWIVLNLKSSISKNIKLATKIINNSRFKKIFRKVNNCKYKRNYSFT
jgi:hypothetical protein